METSQTNAVSETFLAIESRICFSVAWKAKFRKITLCFFGFAPSPTNARDHNESLSAFASPESRSPFARFSKLTFFCCLSFFVSSNFNLCMRSTTVFTSSSRLSLSKTTPRVAPSSLILYFLHVWSSAGFSLQICSNRSTKTFAVSSDTLFFNRLSVLKKCITFAASTPLISPPIFKPAMMTVFFSSEVILAAVVPVEADAPFDCRIRFCFCSSFVVVVLFLGSSSFVVPSSSSFSFLSSSSSSFVVSPFSSRISRFRRFLSLKSTFSFSLLRKIPIFLPSISIFMFSFKASSTSSFIENVTYPNPLCTCVPFSRATHA